MSLFERFSTKSHKKFEKKTRKSEDEKARNQRYLAETEDIGHTVHWPVELKFLIDQRKKNFGHHQRQRSLVSEMHDCTGNSRFAEH